MTPAQKRGAITRRKGSTAIISRLESCSVAFIKPISAVNAEPARPANKSAVTTGPNSRKEKVLQAAPNLFQQKNRLTRHNLVALIPFQ